VKTGSLAPLSLCLVWILTASFAYGQQVEVPPQWRAGPLAVYLFSFPEDGGEYRGSVTIALAVWNANPEDPIRILLDGEEAAVIDREGFFTYSWKLRGSHHLTVVCRYKIFAEAAFWVRPPPPKPAMIPVTEFMERLRRERERVLLLCSFGAVLGVPLGVWTKRKTKLRWDPVFTLPAAVMALGYWRMADLYMLLPLGLTWALTYWLSRDYADLLGLIWWTEHGGRVEELKVDEENRLIELGLRHWRSGFIKRKGIEIINPYPYSLEYRGLIPCYCVDTVVKCRRCGAEYRRSDLECPRCGGEEYDVLGPAIWEDDDRLRVECSRWLAEALILAGILKRQELLVKELQEENIRLRGARVSETVSWARRIVKADVMGLLRRELEVLEELPIMEAERDAEKG